MTEFSFHTTVDRGDDEFDIEVTYDATPYIPASYWQPAEGGEVYITAITDASGKPFTVTPAEEALILRECQDRLDTDFDDLEAAYADDHNEWRFENDMEAW